MKDISISAYAKINLTLDVTAIRDDGYHEVDSIMQRVNLCDSVRIRWFPDKKLDGIQISLKTSWPFIPNDQRNIAYKAGQAMAKYGPGPGHVRIDILKKIPSGAGMGGGSADGAAVICGLNKIWKLNLSPEELSQIGSGIGADLAFGVRMIQGTSCVRARGIGDQMEEIKGLEAVGRYLALLVKPKTSVSTQKAYALLDQAWDKSGLEKRPNNQELIRKMSLGGRMDFSQDFGNVFEAPIMQEAKIIGRLKEDMLNLLADAGLADLVQMSGSGSTVFAIIEKDKAGKELDEIIKKLGRKYQFAQMVEII